MTRVSIKFWKLGTVVAILAMWEVLSLFVLNRKLVPPPTVVFRTAAEMISSLELITHVGVSLGRVAIGFTAGSFIGLAIGIIIGRIRIFEDFVDPLLQLVRSIPPVAIVPLAMVWFGIGEESKFFIISYITVLTAILTSAEAVKAIPIIRVRAAECLGASRKQVFVRIVLPSAFPFVLTGLRIAMGFAFMSLVAAEIIASDKGIGYLIIQSRFQVQTDRMFVGLLMLGLIGYFVDQLFGLVSNTVGKKYEH